MLQKDSVLRIGLPHMGPYSNIVMKSINESLQKVGVNDVLIEVAPPTTKKTVNLGSQHMDENFCLPGKIVLGNLLEMERQGITVALEWDNCGVCRQKAYGLVHQSIMRQLDKERKIEIEMTIIPLQPRQLIKQLALAAPHVPPRKWRIVMREALRAIWKHDWELMKRQVNVPADKPKIGICGEIYTVLEPAANVNLLERLERQGAYVHNGLFLSQFLHLLLKQKLNKSRLIWLLIMARWGMGREIWQWCQGKMRRPDLDYKLYKRAHEAAEKYLPKHDVGGHGRESIVLTIYYALAGFDGVVHILPFPCMPETTVSVLLEEISKDYGIPINHLVFDQQFGEQNLVTRAEAMVSLLRFKKEGLTEVLKTRRPGLWLGVDLGSTSCKAVLVDGETLKIVDSEYQFVNRNPLKAIKQVLSTILSRNPGASIKGMATTGSGRRLAQSLLNAPLAVDEISCQVIGCMLANPGVRSIIEIGGQDSKFISLDQSGVPNWFNMNSICSAGTGAFLASAAREFNVPIEELGKCARAATCAVTLTGRCGVFAEADIVSKQQAGYSKERIIKGMCEALAQNYLSNVCRSKRLEQPVIFTGGVALNGGVADAFVQELGGEVIIHPFAKISGALGAAFIAMMREAVGGLDTLTISQADFSSSSFTCDGCANKCDVSLICRDGRIVAAMDSRCGKYNSLIGEKLPEANIPTPVLSS